MSRNKEGQREKGDRQGKKECTVGLVQCYSVSVRHVFHITDYHPRIRIHVFTYSHIHIFTDSHIHILTNKREKEETKSKEIIGRQLEETYLFVIFKLERSIICQFASFIHFSNLLNFISQSLV